MQKFGHEVCTSRRHQNRICLATQVDMRHIVRFACVPLRYIDGTVGQGLHRHRSDELRGRFGHHYLHASTFFYEGAAEFGGLITSNTTRES